MLPKREIQGKELLEQYPEEELYKCMVCKGIQHETQITRIPNSVFIRCFYCRSISVKSYKSLKGCNCGGEIYLE